MSECAVAVANGLRARVGGEEVLRGVNLRLGPSELVVLTGPTGAGKTTLLKILAGIIPALYPAIDVEGEVRVAGLPPEEAFEEGLTAYVPQDVTAYFIGSRVDEEFGVRGLECREDLLPEGVGCRSLIHELSDGQLYSLLATLSSLSGAKLILLDEPTSHVDPWSLRGVMLAVRRACRSSGAAAVVVEHRAWLVRGYADRLLELRGGVLKGAAGLCGRSATAPQRRGAARARTAGVSGAGDAVDVDGVWFRYVGSREYVLRGACLRVGGGEAVAVLGRNGAGKSTLLKVIAGVLRPERGSVRVEGRVFLVPQAPVRWFSSPTVEGELITYSRFWGFEGGDVDEVAREFMLEGLLRRLPHSLSAGEARRLSLALARVSRADVVLLDEPSLGLDDESLHTLIRCVEELLSSGAAVVAATHDLRLVRALGRACLLNGGVLKCFEARGRLA